MRTRRINAGILATFLVAAAVLVIGPSFTADANTPADPMPPVCGTWVLDQVSSVAELDGQRTQIDAALRTPGVRGLSVRAPWNAVDGNQAIFNRAYEIAQAAGKQLSIRVMAGRHTPARVFDLGAYFYIDSNGQRVPKPFSDSGVAGNPVFEQQYQAMVNTLGAWSRSHGVRLLHLPWYGHMWAEIDNGNEIRAASGYSVDAWTAGHLALLDIGMAESNADLAVEFAMSGNWGSSSSEASKFHDRIVNTLGDWSPRIFLQGNGLGVYDSSPAWSRPINTGLQMYDGTQFAWNMVYNQAASSKATYVEVYASSFTGNTNGSLAAASASFNSNFDASCRYGSPPPPSPTPTATPTPSPAPSPSPSPSPSTPPPSPSPSPSPPPSPSPSPSPSPAPSPSPVPPRDTVDPGTTITYPGNVVNIDVGPIAISGTTTDNRSVGSVNVAIRNRISRLWWHADGTWGAYQAQAAKVAGAGTTAGTWKFTWTPRAPGAFILVARSQDAAGNFDPSPAGRAFTAGTDVWKGRVAPTAIRPSGQAAARAKGWMILKGRTSDDQGVGSVMVAMLDKRTGRWWHPSGWWGAFGYFHADVRTPHALASDWRIRLRALPGNYRVQIAALDTSGNLRIRWLRMHVGRRHVRLGHHRWVR
jgi:hypothetical protein